MAIEFQTKNFAGRFPEIWKGDCKVLPGGFKPVGNYPTGTVIRRAAPLYVDFDTMSAAVCKTGVVVNGGTTSAPRVMKGHYFAAGDTVAVNGGTEKVTVKAVDSSNTGYDVLTFDKALTGVKADDILIETDDAVLAEGAKAASKHVPNAIVSADKEFKGHGIDTFDAGYSALVLIPAIAATPMLPEWLSGMCLKAQPNILYIKQ